MTINMDRNGSELVVSLEGQLDTYTSPQLEAALKDALTGITELKLDLEKLDYISSAGLRVLLSAHRRMSKNGYMTILHPGEVVMGVIEVTGFTEIFNIE